MEGYFFNNGSAGNSGRLGKYKYSGEIFVKRYLKQFLAMLLSNLMSVILITVDGWVVSLFVGEDALNSVNLLTPLTMVTGAITLLLSSGINVVLSQIYGIGSEEKKNKLFRAIVLLTVAFTVGITILQMPISHLIISSYQVSAGIKSMMSLYAVGLIISGSISVISTVCTYIFIASGNIKILLKLTILESSLNLGLDFLFVKFCSMGIFGAGLGTAVSCAIRCIVSVILVQKTVKIFPIKRINCTDEVKNILSNGVPAMTTQLLVSVTGYLMNIIMTANGNMEAITVISICSIGGTIISMISVSFVQAGNSIIGILVGSGNWKIVKKLKQIIMLLSVTTISILVLIVMLFPQMLFEVYGIKDYTNFQCISVRFYILAYIPFTIVNNLVNICVYCGEKKATVITKISESILLIVLFIILDKVYPSISFICYLRSIISVIFLSVVQRRALKKKISEDRMKSRMYFCFKGSEAIDVSKEIFEYLRNSGISGKDIYRLSLVCEELGAYAAKGENGQKIHIFLSVKIYDDYIWVLYLDDSKPAILNENLATNDLIVTNYHLIESIASEFVYRNASGFNNFNMKFTG